MKPLVYGSISPTAIAKKNKNKNTNKIKLVEPIHVLLVTIILNRKRKPHTENTSNMITQAKNTSNMVTQLSTHMMICNIYLTTNNNT